LGAKIKEKAEKHGESYGYIECWLRLPHWYSNALEPKLGFIEKD